MSEHRADVRAGLRRVEAGLEPLERWDACGVGAASQPLTTARAASVAVGCEQRGVDGWRVVVAVGLTSSDEEREVLAASARRALDGVVDLWADHRAHWQRHYAASWCALPDPVLERLVVDETYRLGCAAARSGPVMGLQGPFSPDGSLPPWGGDVHLNGNVQLSYRPCLTGNRLDLLDPLRDYVRRARPGWSALCQDVFGTDGEFVPHATDGDGRPMWDWPIAHYELANGAWLAHMLWLADRLGGGDACDSADLASFMEALASPLVTLLEPDRDGMLHLPRCHSPEWPAADRPWRPDAPYDLALLHWLLGALIDTGTNADRWRQVLDRLAPLPFDPPNGPAGVLRGRAPGGLRVYADTRPDRSHRHHSHLIAIAPLATLRPDDPVEHEIIDASLRTLILHGTGEWVGFSWPWAASVAAAAGRGDHAIRLLREFADRWRSPGGMVQQAPRRDDGSTVWSALPSGLTGAMTLEAGFAALAAVYDVLLQSRPGRITLFPAVPDDWRDVSFEGLRADGAVVVGATMRNGRVRTARLQPERDVDVEVVVPGEDDVSFVQGSECRPARGPIIELRLRAGVDVLLSDPAGAERG